MDKLNEVGTEESKRKRKGALLSRLSSFIRSSIESRRRDKINTAIDVSIVVIGILFARCHIIFGAHPLGIALLSILPTRVWICALGCAVGSLTMGTSGLIWAMISLVVVFLRVIVSATDRRNNDAELFSENILLRMSAALIGGFVGAVYEILISGFSTTSVLFGVSMILLTPILTFAFSGLFDTGYDFFRGILTDNPIFSFAGKSERERIEAVFFQISALIFILFFSLSLAEYVVFGVNVSYIFAGAVTLICAKRFGSLRAAAVGFASTLGLSSLYSVGFMLLGLSSGILFTLGSMYSLIGGGTVLSAWCIYSGGVSGLLSTLPEYSIAAILSLPVIKKLTKEEPPDLSAERSKSASDMLGTMALSFKSHYSGNLDALENSLMAASCVTRRYAERASKPTREELSELIDECVSKYCHGCADFDKCERALYLTPETREKCITKLLDGGKIAECDLGIDNECHGGEGIAASVSRAAAILAEEKYKAYQKDTSADELSLISKLISDARYADECEKATNDTLTDAVTALLPKHGITGGVARVYGVRAPHVIISCEDESGSLISSRALKADLMTVLGTKLAVPEYYKKGRMAVMECSSTSKLAAECAISSRTGMREKVSGDTARAFESKNGRFYTLISDGMGSGREAKEVSELVCDFLFSSLEFSPDAEPILKILNNIVRAKNPDCSATVDLFSIDLISGKAMFIKSGAAPSYIKRGSSLFRISSKTAPLGPLKEVDAEIIKADVQDGDYVIMLSDGVSQNVDDTPWLPILLSKEPLGIISEFAESILRCAFENGNISDDMTVTVTKIKLL